MWRLREAPGERSGRQVRDDHDDPQPVRLMLFVLGSWVSTAS